MRSHSTLWISPGELLIRSAAGDPMQRIGPLREKSHTEINVFSGNHGRKMIEEIEAGFSGSMPAAGLADLYATTFNLWQVGKHDEARANHARTIEALNTMLRYGMEGMKYVLVARGVFNMRVAGKVNRLVPSGSQSTQGRHSMTYQFMPCAGTCTGNSMA